MTIPAGTSLVVELTYSLAVPVEEVNGAEEAPPAINGRCFLDASATDAGWRLDASGDWPWLANEGAPAPLTQMIGAIAGHLLRAA